MKYKIGQKLKNKTTGLKSTIQDFNIYGNEYFISNYGWYEESKVTLGWDLMETEFKQYYIRNGEIMAQTNTPVLPPEDFIKSIVGKKLIKEGHSNSVWSVFVSTNTTQYVIVDIANYRLICPNNSAEVILNHIMKERFNNIL